MTVDYGTDLDWADDLDPTGRVVSGTLLLGQAAYRRLRTRRGSCLDCPDDGIDIQEYLSLAMTPAALSAIPGEVSAELRKDERFVAADVVVTKITEGLHFAIEITPSEGPTFDLTLSVTDAGVKLLGIS